MDIVLHVLGVSFDWYCAAGAIGQSLTVHGHTVGFWFASNLRSGGVF